MLIAFKMLNIVKQMLLDFTEMTKGKKNICVLTIISTDHKASRIEAKPLSLSIYISGTILIRDDVKSPRTRYRRAYLKFPI